MSPLEDTADAKLILPNELGQRILFPVEGEILNVNGTNLDITGVATAGLQAYWKFENGGGVGPAVTTGFNDSESFGDHPLTLASGGTAAFTASGGGMNGIGQAFVFDGSTGLIIDNSTVGNTNVNPIGNAITIEWWWKMGSHLGSTVQVAFAIGKTGATSPTVNFIYDSDANAGFSLGKMRILMTTLSPSFSPTFYDLTGDSLDAVNENHFCFTYNAGGDVKLFVNSILRKLVPGPFGNINWITTSGSEANLIGKFTDVGTIKPTNLSRVDNVKIYNRALTDGGVTSLGVTAGGEVRTNFIAEGGTP